MAVLPTNREPTHPGVMLEKEFLEPLGISQSEFARQLGLSSPQTINLLVNKKRGVSAEFALLLEKALGMSATFWLGLQADWDLYQAQKSLSPARLAKVIPVQ